MSARVYHLIPHTHWDREWHLPAASFRARLVAMMDDLVGRLEADPAFRSFLLDGQSVMLEDYARARPSRGDALRALAAAGRLQVGPWYVLADELIPTGESLVRNLLCGAADAGAWGGRLEVLYSPDAFGHPAALPALAREFGIRTAVLWRGYGGEAGQAGDVFRWVAPDGRDVLVWHLPPSGYEIGAALPPERERLGAAWPAVRDALVPRARTPHVLIPVGADHHAAYPEIGRLRDALGSLEPAHAVRVSRLDEAMRDVAGGVEGAEVPEVRGELRWSYRYAWTLQGAHGTRAGDKRRHGVAELALWRVAEPLAALALRRGVADQRATLDLAWRTLLRGQFHDTLCGTTGDAAAAAQRVRLDAVRAYASEIARAARDGVIGYDADAARERGGPDASALVLWNPAARPRSGVTIADVSFFRRDVLMGAPAGRTPRRAAAPRGVTLLGPDGAALPVQVLDRRVALERREAVRHYPDLDEVETFRVAFRAPSVPGLGFRAFRAEPVPGPAPAGPGVRATAGGMENEFVAVALSGRGTLTIHDRRSAERFAGLLALESEGDAGDCYTFSPARDVAPGRLDAPVRRRRLAAGPLVAAWEWSGAMRAGRDPERAERPGRVDVRATIVVHAASPLVRCVLTVENRATDHRLRLRLPLGLAGVPAVAGAAFGTERRPPRAARTAGYPLEMPVATAPAHRFVAAARGARGLAVLVPAFCEYEWTPAGDLLVTLLRAVGELSRDDLPERPGHAAWPTAVPGAQCPGVERLELALAPVTEAMIDRGDALPELWEDACLPLVPAWFRAGAGVRAPETGIALEGRGLVFSAAKPAQTGAGIVVRCYNATGERVGGAWRLAEPVRTAHRVPADERGGTAAVIEERGHVVRFAAGPHEIVTFRIT